MAVNNEIGTIQDIERISELVRGCGAVFHCDAAQAPLAMNMGSMASQTDMLIWILHEEYPLARRAAATKEGKPVRERTRVGV